MGLLAISLTIAAFLLTPSLVRHGYAKISGDVFFVRAQIRLLILLIGVFCSGWLLVPWIGRIVSSARERWPSRSTPFALAGVCAFLGIFIVEIGRHQFGAFDYDILIEVGWRQILGQRPYVDFVTSTPPGFNLGMKFAYEFFGVNWDANLYLSALFSCFTFLWMYWLLRRLKLTVLPAIGTAFAVQCAAMLPLCFWWYNNSVLLLAAGFFLSCLVYARDPGSVRVQISYVVALAILSLMKPNIAGVTIAGCFALLLIVSQRKSRLLLLTIAASVLAVVILLASHTSIPAMVASYHSASKERGGFSTFGYNELNRFGKYTSLIWFGVLSLPLIALLSNGTSIAKEGWRKLIVCLFYPLSLVIALYGLATNGEFRDVECAVLLAAGGVLLFGERLGPPILRRTYIAVLFASIAGDIYIGSARTRVYTIGPHQFFEWQDNNRQMPNGFLKNMRLSSTMIDVEEQIQYVLKANPGPYFFGPRVDFNYAVFGLTSPPRFPAWWHPGTAFGKAEESELIQQWRADRFQTLIFLKDDYTYYSADFLEAIHENYVSDNRYPALTIYRRRRR